MISPLNEYVDAILDNRVSICWKALLHISQSVFLVKYNYNHSSNSLFSPVNFFPYSTRQGDSALSQFLVKFFLNADNQTMVEWTCSISMSD